MEPASQPSSAPARSTSSATRCIQGRSSSGRYDTPHSRDGIFEQAGGSRAQVKLAKRTGGLRGYVGTIAIGVVA